VKMRAFGRDAVEVSEVGIGTWQLGAEWGDVDDETAAAVLRAAFDNGVTFYDTADIYGGGKSEQFLGEILDGRRDEAVLATKFGNVTDEKTRSGDHHERQ